MGSDKNFQNLIEMASEVIDELIFITKDFSDSQIMAL